jgi:hypothetical protein
MANNQPSTMIAHGVDGEYRTSLPLQRARDIPCSRCRFHNCHRPSLSPKTRRYRAHPRTCWQRGCRRWPTPSCLRCSYQAGSLHSKYQHVSGLSNHLSLSLSLSLSRLHARILSQHTGESNSSNLALHVNDQHNRCENIELHVGSKIPTPTKAAL